jgi:dihydrofolate reductase
MTQFVFYTGASLDGFLADDNDSLDWLVSQDIDEAGPMNYKEFIDGIGAIVMGATTYQWIVDNHISKGEKWFYSQPSFLFTHREIEPVDPTIQLVSGSPADLRETLDKAAEGKDVWVVGGGDLAAQFADAGMLDEIVVSFAPVFLGSGRPLFTKRYDLELIEHDRNRAFLCAKYSVKRPPTQV